MLRRSLQRAEDDELRRVFTDWVKEVGGALVPQGARLCVTVVPREQIVPPSLDNATVTWCRTSSLTSRVGNCEESPKGSSYRSASDGMRSIA